MNHIGCNSTSGRVYYIDIYVSLARRAPKNMMSFRFILARQMVMDGEAVEYICIYTQYKRGREGRKERHQNRVRLKE